MNYFKLAMTAGLVVGVGATVIGFYKMYKEEVAPEVAKTKQARKDAEESIRKGEEKLKQAIKDHEAYMAQSALDMAEAQQRHDLEMEELAEMARKADELNKHRSELLDQLLAGDITYDEMVAAIAAKAA